MGLSTLEVNRHEAHIGLIAELIAEFIELAVSLTPAAALAFALCPPATGAAQSAGQAAADAAAIATVGEDSSVTPSRVVDPVDESRLVKLTGNTHPRARAEFDQGPADPQRRMERIMLVLRRSPEQEAALDRFMAEQYDPKSPNFHHWLEPEEFGRLYGPSDADMAAVTSWLQNHGFQIVAVAKGRVSIQFSGTVDQVQRALPHRDSPRSWPTARSTSPT